MGGLTHGGWLPPDRPPETGPPPQPGTPPDPAAGPDPVGGAGRRLLLVGGAVAGVVVVGVILALLAALLPGGGPRATFNDPAQRRQSAVAKQLAAAAAELSQTAAVRYTGSYLDSDGNTVEVDAELTNLGWTKATLTQGGQEVAVLASGSGTYLKASKKYWSKHRAPRNTLGEYAKRWVRVPAGEAGIDLPRGFAPGALGAALQASVGRGEARTGKTSEIDGIEVREITARRVSYYVTTAKPHRIVRIASHRDTGGQGGALTRPGTAGQAGVAAPAVAPGGPDDFEFDLSGLSPEETRELFTELRNRVGKLKHSVDSQVTFSLAGGITLRPCTVAGCTANVTMSNSVSSDSRYLVVKKKVTARVRIVMTFDGAPVRTCTKTRAMKPNGEATVRCRATYVVPRDGRTHNVVATATATAVATVSADIKRMYADLKAERTQGPPKPPGKDADLGPSWRPCDPTQIPGSSDCEKVAARIMKKLGGEKATIRPRGGARLLGRYRGYDTEWHHHVVVVKNGRVYDAWTGRYGEPIEVYKSRWGADADEFINFGF